MEQAVKRDISSEDQIGVSNSFIVSKNIFLMDAITNERFLDLIFLGAKERGAKNQAVIGACVPIFIK